MKIINETSCKITVYVYENVLHVVIDHKAKNWLGGTTYRGGGQWSFDHPHSVHFEMYDDYDETGEKEINESDHEKLKSFCLIPETEEEIEWCKGQWMFTQNKETEYFSCVPLPNSIPKMKTMNYLFENQ